MQKKRKNAREIKMHEDDNHKRNGMQKKRKKCKKEIKKEINNK